jgi:Ala-tRNA(Pro) deacylase
MAPDRGETMPIPDRLAAAFAALGIEAPCVEHPPLRTVADAHAHWDELPGLAVKNLFIKDAGKQYWLVTLPADRSVDTKVLAALIGARRISFGSAEDLRAILGVEPGSVTPLAAINDTQNRVRVVLHAGMAEAAAVLVHPLVNTATLIMKSGDLLRFMDAHGGAALVDLAPAFREGGM